MLIAREKRDKNIAEYILYMWQIEDLIRASKFDLDTLEVTHVYPMTEDPELRQQSVEWFANIIAEMKETGIEKRGHLRVVKEVLHELAYLHNSLLTVTNDNDYQRLYQKALPDINAFRERSGGQKLGDVELCFNALYAKLLLRMQQQEVSEATEQAMDSFRAMLVYLATAWHRSRQGKAGYGAN